MDAVATNVVDGASGAAYDVADVIVVVDGNDVVVVDPTVATIANAVASDIVVVGDDDDDNHDYDYDDYNYYYY